MIARANKRIVHSAPLADKGVLGSCIAQSRIDIKSARLLVLNAAENIDRTSARDAKTEISMVKIAVPNLALAVLDRAIQTHGAAGLSQDFPLSRIWAYLRTVYIAESRMRRTRLSLPEPRTSVTAPCKRSSSPIYSMC
jgi:acyl-CoA dehydrogenase